jgi:hypothetical protein
MALGCVLLRPVSRRFMGHEGVTTGHVTREPPGVVPRWMLQPARRRAPRSSGSRARQAQDSAQPKDGKALGLDVPPTLLVRADG